MILRQALVAVLAASAVAYVPRTATFGHRKKFGTAQRVAPRSRSTLVATIPVPVAETAKGADPAPLPLHPAVHLGQLDNGLSYAILPNRSPPGRFEVHLEVFAGSANENEDQQGMAHILEHIAYMGSRKRERLFGTGSQTNAYTDFHHTVFYAACPTYASTGPSAGGGSGPLGSIFKGLRGAQAGKDNKAPMLPLALDAVLDVLEARIEKGRLEQERAAVLSEMQMVNTMEYRVECQILSSLHNENILSERFPIGKENLIRSWTTDDVREYHQAHYRPDNAMLYVVGDVVAEEAEELIGKLFGHLEPSEARREGPLNLKAAQSKHFPPVTHEWTMQERPKNIALPDELLRDLSVTSSRDLVSRTKMFYHELLQGFSFHLFAKRPVEPVTSSEAFMRALAKRVAIAALQIRLNVNARSDPPFTYVEFNQLDSPREGAAVCSLDLMAEPSRWREAILVVVSEIRRFAEFGLTQNELERYLAAMLADSAQIRAQGDRISNADQLQYLMENTACGHTFMDPEQSHMATEAAVRSLTLEDVNSVAKEVTAREDRGRWALVGTGIAGFFIMVGTPTSLSTDLRRLRKARAKMAKTSGGAAGVLGATGRPFQHLDRGSTEPRLAMGATRPAKEDWILPPPPLPNAYTDFFIGDPGEQLLPEHPGRIGTPVPATFTFYSIGGIVFALSFVWLAADLRAREGSATHTAWGWAITFVVTVVNLLWFRSARRA